jgi:hypothetical protein
MFRRPKAKRPRTIEHHIRLDDTYKKVPAYLDAHCAAFLGRPEPKAKNAVEQQAIDRGTWDGRHARAKAHMAKR